MHKTSPDYAVGNLASKIAISIIRKLVKYFSCVSFRISPPPNYQNTFLQRTVIDVSDACQVSLPTLWKRGFQSVTLIKYSQAQILGRAVFRLIDGDKWLGQAVYWTWCSINQTKAQPRCSRTKWQPRLESQLSQQVDFVSESRRTKIIVLISLAMNSHILISWHRACLWMETKEHARVTVRKLC